MGVLHDMQRRIHLLRAKTKECIEDGEEV